MPDKVDDCLACRIYTVDIQQRPDIKYEALSYVWGDPRHTHQIYLARDDEEEWSLYPLHENLWRFLQHCWQQKMYDRLFWTDCLCLNQKDRGEVAQQIPRMGSIYSSAEQVVTWLQLDGHTNRCLMELLGMYDSGRRPAPEKVEGLLMAAYTVANDVYWRRAWIVQEVVLARRVWVISDSLSTDLSVLQTRLVQLSSEFGPANRHSQLFMDRTLPSMGVHCTLRKAEGKVPPWQLVWDFGGYEGYESSRPADQVFGLLGMVADNEDGSSPLQHIRVDYDRPVVDIQLDFLYESSPPWKRLIGLPRRNIRIYSELVPIEDRRDYGKQTCPVLAHWASVRDVPNMLRRRYPQNSVLRGYSKKTALRLSCLVDYVSSCRTSRRHKHFGFLTLNVFLALHAVIVSFPRNMYTFLLRGTELCFKPTKQQTAAVLGFRLLRDRDIPEYEMIYGWRCAAHCHTGKEDRGAMLSKRGANQKFATRKARVRKVLCEEDSSSCDKSFIVFELLDIGMRMYIDAFDEEGRGDFHLKIQDMQPEGNGVMAQAMKEQRSR